VENVQIAKNVKKETSLKNAKSVELKTVFLTAKKTDVKFAGKKKRKQRFWIFETFKLVRKELTPL